MRTTVNLNDALRHYLSMTVSPRRDVALPVFDGGADGGLQAGVAPNSNRALYEALDDVRPKRLRVGGLGRVAKVVGN